MGTRGVTGIKVDGELRVAQYGQWDHYPSGQGCKALAILRATDPDVLAGKVRRCRFAHADEVKGKTFDDFPQMHRDHGAKIIRMVAESPDGLVLLDDRKCEWAEWSYLVDLDARTFSCFKGDLNGRLLVTCSLDGLPSDEAFCAAAESARESGQAVSIAGVDYIDSEQFKADTAAAEALRSRGWVVTSPVAVTP